MVHIRPKIHLAPPFKKGGRAFTLRIWPLGSPFEKGGLGGIMTGCPIHKLFVINYKVGVI
jgi:hypothetical protein